MLWMSHLRSPNSRVGRKINNYYQSNYLSLTVSNTFLADEEENVDYKTFLATNEIPQEFWAVQKLIRYLRIGNQVRNGYPGVE